MLEQNDLMNTVEDTQKDKYLCFQLEKTEYVVPIRYVVEIIGMQPITAVPDVPKYVKGVINLRGKIIPVVDVRLRFGLQEKPYNDRTCIIVVQLDDFVVGLIVDAVNEVLNIAESQIEPPPKVKKSKKSRFISGLGKVQNSVKIILKMEAFLLDSTSVSNDKPEKIAS